MAVRIGGSNSPTRRLKRSMTASPFGIGRMALPSVTLWTESSRCWLQRMGRHGSHLCQTRCPKRYLTKVHSPPAVLLSLSMERAMFGLLQVAPQRESFVRLIVVFIGM